MAVVRRPRPVRGVPRPPDRPPSPRVLFWSSPPWSSAPAREPPSSALPPPPAAPPPVPLAVARWGTLGEGRASSRGEGRVRPGGVPPRAGRLGSTWGREESSRERLWGRVTEAEGPRAGLRGRRGRRLRRRRRRPVRVEPEREVVRAGVAWRGVRFPSRGFCACVVWERTRTSAPSGQRGCSRGSRGTGSGTAGKARRGRWLGGDGARPWASSLPSPSVTAPLAAAARRIPGPREPDITRRRALLPSFGWRPGRPSHGATALPPLPPPRGSRGRGGLSSVRPGRRRAVGPGGFRRSRRPLSREGAEPSARGRRRCRLPTRPVLKHGPRSLTRARVRGSSESRRGAMKVKGLPPPSGGGCPRWDPEASPSPPRAHHRPVSPAAPGRWSTSVRVRTRKMVNYAWAGRSQRKLWWRSVAVLTCKSVVRPGYRGERLIEPSSSWFPPKFPSG